MKVKMLVSMVGPRFALEPGDEYSCGDAEARRLIDAGYAVSVAAVAPVIPAPTPKIERATKAKPKEKR